MAGRPNERSGVDAGSAFCSHTGLARTGGTHRDC